MKTFYKKLLVLLTVIAAAITVCSLILEGEPLKIAAASGGAMATAGLIFLIVSMSRKLSRINSQLKTASSGTYTTDFPEKINDEFDMLSMRLSTLFRDMMKYDKLRAKDVTKSAKAYSSLSANISEAVILLDFEGDTASLNPPAQEIWNTSSKEFPLDVVLKHAQNADFAKFIKHVIDSNAQDEKCWIYLPTSSKKEVYLKAVPVKSMDGQIPVIILLAEEAVTSQNVSSDIP